MERRIPKQITLLNDSIHPLSEKEIVDATVAFANGSNLKINGLAPRNFTGADAKLHPERLKEVGDVFLQQFINDMRDFQAISDKPGARSPFQVKPEDLVNNLDELRDLFRTRTRRLLSMAFTDPGAAAEEAAWGGGIMTGLIFHGWDTRHSLGRTPNGLRFQIEFTFTTYIDLIQLGLVLLLDEQRGMRAKLCQCQWEPCGLFFWEVKPATGRPQRKYCRPEHMQKAHDQNASKRMRRKRSEPVRKPARRAGH